jgi:hypothetical protein
MKKVGWVRIDGVGAFDVLEAALPVNESAATATMRTGRMVMPRGRRNGSRVADSELRFGNPLQAL